MKIRDGFCETLSQAYFRTINNVSITFEKCNVFNCMHLTVRWSTSEEGCKFLGMYLDENLSWQNHINHISYIISKSLFIMRQVKHILDRKSMKTLYYSLFICAYINKIFFYYPYESTNVFVFCLQNVSTIFVLCNML